MVKSQLSNADSRTIRLACEALSLIIDGAVRRLETQYGPDNLSDRGVAIDALILHAREALDGWSTRHELGDAPTELDTDATRLFDETNGRYEMLFAHVTPDAARQIVDSITEYEPANNRIAQVLVRQLQDIGA